MTSNTGPSYYRKGDPCPIYDQHFPVTLCMAFVRPYPEQYVPQFKKLSREKAQRKVTRKEKRNGKMLLQKNDKEALLSFAK